MRKKLYLCLLFLSAVFLFSCTEEVIDEIDYKEILTEAIDSIDLPLSTTNDLDLISETTISNIKITLTWTSDNAALTSDGITTRQSENVIVNLTCVASCENCEDTVSKDFVVTVTQADSIDEIFTKAFDSIEIPDELYFDYTFPNNINVEGINVVLNWSSSNDNLLITNNVGNVIIPENDIDINVTINCEADISGSKKNEVFIIKLLSYKSIIEKTILEVNVPSKTNTDIVLPLTCSSYDIVTIQWSTNNSKVLSKTGVCGYVSSETEVTLSASFYIEEDNGDTYFYDKDINYKVIVEPYSSERVFALVAAEIAIPEKVSNSITLASSFAYDCSGTWTSNNENIMSTTGIITPDKEDYEITLTLTLSRFGDTSEIYEYKVTVLGVGDEVLFDGHNLVDRVADYKLTNLSNLVYEDKKIKLASGALSGTYESAIFKTRDFTSVVGSYSCITTSTATCEVSFSIRVDGVWSKYISYGTWGLGKTNTYYDTSDAIASLNTDEINTVNSKNADGIKYKVTLKRDALTTASPELSLVACAIKVSDSSYAVNIDIASLPNSWDIDVPKLYQHDVPTIGGSICSATTTTMLLKYKGFSFTDKGYAYEHQYIAYMVADPGHNNPTYGNWSYNMITAGAFGVDAYVGRMYSWDELRYHLVNVGPVGASIKGTFGSYTTNGHLIVVRGYSISNGQTTVICNDPNISGVYYTVPLQTFITCWRNVVYIVE